ncbi:peptidoglycan-binding protein [Mesorhizobium sp. KR2-14]|uniref:peptidoglycan-binding protein n=1 Tax=Mesorhizobium sp. KR2-14 TaxID=3156610 RepID=UPI0032B369FD
MNSKRSYLESLNAGRPRRPYATLEDLNRSLDNLQQRLSRHAEPASGFGNERQPRPFEAPQGALHRDEAPTELRRPEPLANAYERQPYQAIARDLDHIRAQEDGMAAFGKIASELNALREDLRQQVSSGMRREFETMRRDMERIGQPAASRDEQELALEFERLSGAIQALSERSDDKSLNLLRLELEQVKGALDALAREETVRSIDRRWDEFDRRWTDFEHRVSAAPGENPAIAALAARLEQISNAVDNLPESLSLRSLEEKVRMLASAVDHFVRQHEPQGSETFAQIEERLDEISRAIVASAAAARMPNFDPEPFERIEARISALARQIEEVAEDRPGREVIERLNLLSQRVDEITEQVHLPQAAVERLGHQIAMIAEKIEHAPAPDADHIFQGIEQRFDLLSSMIERRQGDVLEQGNLLFRDLERRLDEVADRLDLRAHEPAFDSAGIMDAIDARFASLAERIEAEGFGADDHTIRSLEARLDDISSRLDTSSRQFTGIDPELIRNLEAQVAGLSEHLARPTGPLPEFEDIAPRLDDIERSIASSHENLMEAARQAAESAVRSMAGSVSQGEAVAGLADDLRTLEALTRRSDERNTKTFEAIHDTLLKIVDRLGSLEGGHAAMPAAEPAGAPKMTVEDAPSLDLDTPLPLMEALEAPAPVTLAERGARSPAQAAADAAVAALGSDVTGDGQGSEPRSRFGGLGRMFAGKKHVKAEQPAEAAPTALDSAPAVDLDEPLDPKFANRPLEPGSGAPDLNAIMRRVRDERGQGMKPAEADAAKADFIAAARRAAQAAAAEAEALKRGSEDKSPVRAGRIADLLKARRKPILMAAVAIMMALAGLQLGKALTADDTRLADSAAAPAAEQATETAVADEARPADETVEAASEVPAARNVDAARSTTPVDEAEIDAAEASETAGASSMETSLVQEVETAAEIVVPVEAGPVALREAAASGDAMALFEIGSRYAEGRGVAVDMAAAAKWYEESAKLGFAPAQYRIGNFYEKGLAGEPDVAKARNWYELSAAQGNASAMHNLAVLFAMGADGAPDNETAVRWFTQAAELGVKDSQFNLGILAAKGVGMPQSLEESYRWFALVAKTGDKDAAAKRDEIAKALRPEQLERARAATELWKARPLDAAANSVDVPEAWQESQAQTASVDVKKAISNIQTILARNGYDAGGTDGVMGEKTKSALAAFQKDNGMAPTGEVDEKVVRALLALR